jgi:hypothetical protein
VVLTRVFLGGVVFRRRCRRFHIVAFSQSEPSLSFSAVVPSRFILYDMVGHGSLSWSSLFAFATVVCDDDSEEAC